MTALALTKCTQRGPDDLFPTP